MKTDPDYLTPFAPSASEAEGAGLATAILAKQLIPDTIPLSLLLIQPFNPLNGKEQFNRIAVTNNSL